jgi:hypothetical protein
LSDAAVARGSVRRKDNGWSYRVDLGPDPATGKRRQLAKQGFRTRKEAEAALGAVLTSIARGSVVDRSTTTTEEFLRDWLSSQEHRLRATTLYSYENTLPGAAVWTIPCSSSPRTTPRVRRSPASGRVHSPRQLNALSTGIPHLEYETPPGFRLTLRRMRFRAARARSPPS